MILEPNYQPEPPSNQQYDDLDFLEDYGKEIIVDCLSDFTVEIPIDAKPKTIWYVEKKGRLAKDFSPVHPHDEYRTKLGAVERVRLLKSKNRFWEVSKKPTYRIREITYMPISEEIIEL